MSNKLEEMKDQVTEKVTNKVAEQISNIVIDKIKSIGEFSCDDMTINLSFKNLHISVDSDRDYQDQNK